jgi:hypothetical protein
MLADSNTFTIPAKYEGLFKHQKLLYKYHLPMLVRHTTNSEAHDKFTGTRQIHRPSNAGISN